MSYSAVALFSGSGSSILFKTSTRSLVQNSLFYFTLRVQRSISGYLWILAQSSFSSLIDSMLLNLYFLYKSTIFCAPTRLIMALRLSFLQLQLKGFQLVQQVYMATPKDQMSRAGVIQIVLNISSGEQQQTVPLFATSSIPLQQNLAKFQSMSCNQQNLKLSPIEFMSTFPIFMSLCTIPALWHLSIYFKSLQKISGASWPSNSNALNTIVYLQGQTATVLNQVSQSEHLSLPLQYLFHSMGQLRTLIMQFYRLNY